MPYIHIYTDAELKNETKQEFLIKVAKTTAETLGRPQELMNVFLHSSPDMLFGGNRSNGALIVLESVEYNSQEAVIAKNLSELVSASFAILLENVNIKLARLIKKDIGIGGKLYE